MIKINNNIFLKRLNTMHNSEISPSQLFPHDKYKNVFHSHFLHCLFY